LIVVDGEAPLATLGWRTVERSTRLRRLGSVERLARDDVLDADLHVGHDGAAPKGVQLIHRNLLAAIEGLDELISSPEDGA